MTKTEEVRYKDFLKVPNLVTLGRVFLALLILIFTCLNYKIYLIKWFFISGILSDKLDGFLARKLNQKTKLGLILEQIADTWLVIFTTLFITFRLDFPVPLLVIYLIIIFIALISLVAVFLYKKKLFAEKLIIAEISIVFTYGAGLFYLFNLPGKLAIAIFAVFLGFVSLVDYLSRLYKFNSASPEDGS